MDEVQEKQINKQQQLRLVILQDKQLNKSLQLQLVILQEMATKERSL